MIVGSINTYPFACSDIIILMLPILGSLLFFKAKSNINLFVHLFGLQTWKS